MPPLSCFASCAIGLESILARELAELAPQRTIQVDNMEPGGVQFTAGLAGVYASNLHLRTASRIVVRLGGFRASTFHELERRARRLPWNTFVRPGAGLEIRVTSRKSRLYHQEAVAQRLETFVREATGAPGDSGSAPAGQAIAVRLYRDQCTISVDSSGELLHRRGYRQATAKAPLRETLGAAMLLASGWDGSGPLLDPMCGSGTIPIEAALLARRIPPGLRRRFAFQDWPGFDSALWQQLQREGAERMLPAADVPILGSDRDEGAVAAARANAERAGVSGDIAFRRAAISAVDPPNRAGWLVTNPPYGVRVGERRRLRDLYAQLGNVARRRCGGWRLALLSVHEELERQIALPLQPRFETLNGGIRVRLVQGLVPATGSAPG
jgi:putative N6-adenine-specific DNA methylase